MALITSANARELAAKSLVVRQEAARVREIMMAKAQSAIAEAEQTPIYVRQRLARVRIQLDRIDEMLLIEKDPSKLDRLASAQSRLEEQERRLSNRSLPPTLRPKPGNPNPKPRLTQPVEAMEQQTVPSQDLTKPVDNQPIAGPDNPGSPSA